MYYIYHSGRPFHKHIKMLKVVLPNIRLLGNIRLYQIWRLLTQWITDCVHTKYYFYFCGAYVYTEYDVISIYISKSISNFRNIHRDSHVAWLQS